MAHPVIFIELFLLNDDHFSWGLLFQGTCSSFRGSVQSVYIQRQTRGLESRPV